MRNKLVKVNTVRLLVINIFIVIMFIMIIQKFEQVNLIFFKYGLNMLKKTGLKSVQS